MFKAIIAAIIYVSASFAMSYAIVSIAYKISPMMTLVAGVCFFLRMLAGSTIDSVVEEKRKELNELKEKGNK